MTNTIYIYGGGSAPIDTLNNATSVSGTVSGTGQFTVRVGTTEHEVSLIEAHLSDDELTIDASHTAGGTPLEMNHIRVTASGAGVGSFLGWSPIAGTSGLRITVETPTDRNDWVLWELGVSVPEIKLKVKIVRV